MGFKPLVWYCQPTANGIWAKVTDSAFGSYTPCAIDSLVISTSHLVLLGLCFYRIWLIKNSSRVKRFCLKSNYYNYMLGLLTGFLTAEPLLRMVMGISIFNLQEQTGLAPYEVNFQFLVFLFNVDYSFCLHWFSFKCKNFSHSTFQYFDLFACV